MQISRSTLQKALLKAYRCAASPEAEAVTAHDLEDVWPSIGLRKSDFAAALEELIHRKWLVVTEHGRDKWVDLTPEGIRALHESDGSWRRDLLDWVILKRTSLRLIKPPVAQPRIRQRRSGESSRAK